ncbi:MAG: hypothetical protein C4K47_06635 [Candidatus Thorarchaeota archaeon]|nr:MAG: hypothetical protein C4K47_06635 [Candidatus Thorarchaeota archaeon]
MAAFVAMAYIVYRIMSGRWDWGIPYLFITTVFRLLSLLVFFLAVMMVNSLASPMIGGQTLNTLLAGLYNTLILHSWVMEPYGLTSPLANIEEVFASFRGSLLMILNTLWQQTFTFLYFLFAAVGVALFLQSLVRMDHKFVGGAFISIQLILVVAAFREVSSVPNFVQFPSDFFYFLGSNVQLLALISFAYLEISYQMIYSYSVGKPVEEREETLKKQLLALRMATRKQDAIERGETVSSTAMSRSSGATVFSFVREAIERRVVGTSEALENLDAVADVRRLQNFVDEILRNDPAARDELTARAAAPSQGYVVRSTVLGSVFRLGCVVAISFLLMNPSVFVALLSLPPGISDSVELLQPEFILLFLVPMILLFPFVAMLIGSLVAREGEIKPDKEEKEKLRKEKKELKAKKRAAEKARKERSRIRKEVRGEAEEKDEWDRAIEQVKQ